METHLLKTLHERVGLRQLFTRWYTWFAQDEKKSKHRWEVVAVVTHVMWKREGEKKLREEIQHAAEVFTGHRCTDATLCIQSLEKQAHEVDLVQRRVNELSWELDQLLQMSQVMLENEQIEDEVAFRIYELRTEIGTLQADPQAAGLHLAKAKLIELYKEREDLWENYMDCYSDFDNMVREAGLGQVGSERHRTELKISRTCERYALPFVAPPERA